MDKKALKKNLKERLEHIPPEDMDEVSWGMREGVIISGNEAKLFLELLNNLKP